MKEIAYSETRPGHWEASTVYHSAGDDAQPSPHGGPSTTLRVLAWLLNREEEIERGEDGHPFMSTGWKTRLFQIAALSLFSRALWDLWFRLVG